MKHICPYCGSEVIPSRAQEAALRQGRKIFCRGKKCHTRYYNLSRKVKFTHEFRIVDRSEAMHCRKYEECYSKAAYKGADLVCPCPDLEFEQDYWRKSTPTAPSNHDDIADEVKILL